MKKIIGRDPLKIEDIPATYIIEELERLREKARSCSLPLIMPAPSSSQLSYWPEPEQKPKTDDVIIIEL